MNVINWQRPTSCGRLAMDNAARSFWQSRAGLKEPPMLVDLTNLARRISLTWKHERQREQLQRDMEQFERDGGVIERLPPGAGSGRVDPFNPFFDYGTTELNEVGS